MAYSQKQANIAEKMGVNQYQYCSIFPTALTQLDHIFNVIGNGISYSNEDGVYHSTFDIDRINEKHKVRLEELQTKLEEAKEIFGDKLPPYFGELYSEEKEVLERGYVKREPQYYFNLNNVVQEHMAHLERHKDSRWGKSDMPYPICGYSLIMRIHNCKCTATRKLGLICTKAWIQIMTHTLANTEDESQKETIQQWITEYNKIVDGIETKSEKKS